MPKNVKVSEGEKKIKALHVNLNEKEFQILIDAIAEFLRQKVTFIRLPSPLIYQEETAQNLKLANRLLQIVINSSQSLKLASTQGDVV